MKGPEDTPGWLRYIGEPDSPTVEACRFCQNTIVVWHCVDGGCCWCAECGTKAKDIREKRKNGSD